MMLPKYIIHHICGFLDFPTVIRLISVPDVYRYLRLLADYVVYRDATVNETSTCLEILEPYYHLNGYRGLTVFDICRFIGGYRLHGNNISTRFTSQLWIQRSQYYRMYGPAVSYFSSDGKIFKIVWYYYDLIHRYDAPAITLYHDNGLPKTQLYFRLDYPYSYNGKPTAIEYDMSGNVIVKYWHDSKTGRVLKVEPSFLGSPQ